MDPVKYNPAALIGAVTAALVALGQVLDTGVGGNGEFSWWKVLVTALPLVAGFLIKRAVITKAWLFDVISSADTVLDALRPIANEVDVPPHQRPSQP